MDAIKLLKEDHEKVKKLFREYEGLGDRAEKSKARIAEQVFMELDVHARIEEEIFYPAVDAKADKEGKKLVDEANEEHHVVKMLISEMQALTAGEDQFDAKFKVLTENVEHHIEEEEGEMFPDAQEKLGKETEQLGERMMQRKQELMASMQAASR